MATIQLTSTLLLCVLLTACGKPEAVPEPARVGGRATPTNAGQPLPWVPTPAIRAAMKNEPGRAEFFLLIGAKTDIREATRAYYQTTGLLPKTVDELTDSHLLFHRPMLNGTPWEYVDWPAGTEPSGGRINVRFGSERVMLAVMGRQGDPNSPIEMDIDFDPFIISAVTQRAYPPTPVDQLRTEVDWAAVPSDEAENAANHYLFASDQMNEARLIAFGNQIRARAGAYVNRYGRLPDSWAELLRALEIEPVDYTPEKLAPNVGQEEMRAWVGVDSSGMILKIELKPTVNGVDTSYLIYSRAANGVGLGRPELKLRAHDFTPPSEFRCLFSARIPTDPLPGSGPVEAEKLPGSPETKRG